MTREEAIKIFNTVLCLGKCDCPKDEIEECLKMAIEALQQQPSEDCISRKAAIDALHSYFAEGFNEDRWWNSTHILDAINKAPSVSPQPSKRTEERTETHECDTEHIIKTTIKEYLDKDYDDVTELLLALNKDLCERIRKEK